MVAAISSLGVHNYDPEYQRILQELMRFGIAPSGNKNIDKGKLEQAKTELIQKIQTKNNEEFLKNTNLQISKTVLNEKGDAETSDAEIFSGTLENANVGNDEAKYKYTEENIEEG